MTSIETQQLSLTIAIPTFRRYDLLEIALESAMFQEGNFGYEVLVLDDDPEGITSPSVDRLLNLRDNNVIVRYIRNEINLGIYKNWNKCIDECRTDYLTILSDDDLLHKNFLKEISHYLPRFDLIAVDANTIGGKRIEYNSILSFLRNSWHAFLSGINRIRFLQAVTVRDVLKGLPYEGSLGVVFSRKKAIDIGRFKPEFYPSSDYEFFIRFWKTGRCVKLRKTLASYRWQVNISLNLETLRGWLIKDQQVKFDFISECLPKGLHKIGKFLVDYQSNVSAYRYKVQVPDFQPFEILGELEIPRYKFARTRLGQNISSLLWRFLLVDIFLPRRIRRRLQIREFIKSN